MIAFNAAYASEIYHVRSFSERRTQLLFLNRLFESDVDNKLYQMVWQEFPRSIRLLIDNAYIYQPFWEYQKGLVSEEEWKRRFAHDKAAANRGLGRMDTRKVLAIIFDRLYVLRNQLIHGAATWNGKVNCDQVRDGTKILEKLVPTVISLMLENGSGLWGKAAFPVIDDEYGYDVWDKENTSRCFIHIANSLGYRKITGYAPPNEIISAIEYEAAGLPWFDYYGADLQVLDGAQKLANMDSVAAKSIKMGKGEMKKNQCIKPGKVITFGQQHIIREGKF